MFIKVRRGQTRLGERGCIVKPCKKSLEELAGKGTFQAQIRHTPSNWAQNGRMEESREI